jgi:hypothetical protein
MQFSLFCFLIIFAAFTSGAWALTASNTQIINNASLSYNDGTGTKTVNAVPVIVTVTLIPGTPTVTKGPDQTTPYTGPNTPLTNTFTITASNTNGPDNYSLTPAIIATTNATGSSIVLASITPLGGPQTSPVLLGATVTLAATTANVLVVPADGNAGDNQVNGIAALDWVVVNGEARQVASIVDNAANTSTITLVSALSANPGAGVLVGEQKTVTVTVNSGTITTAGQNIVITKQLTIASTTDPTKTATAGPITDTYTSGLATLTKFVRNVTAVPTMTGTGTKYTYNTIDYWPSGITAKPGEVLEYILVANNSGTGSVSAAAITDTLPTTYVTLKTGAYSGGRDITYLNETGTASYLTSVSDGDAATYASPILTVNVGTGGIIATGTTVRVLYQVTVNP